LKTIYKGQLSAGLNKVNSTIDDIQQGLYLVVIRNGNQKLVKKLMIQ